MHRGEGYTALLSLLRRSFRNRTRFFFFFLFRIFLLLAFFILFLPKWVYLYLLDTAWVHYTYLISLSSWYSYSYTWVKVSWLWCLFGRLGYHLYANVDYIHSAWCRRIFGTSYGYRIVLPFKGKYEKFAGICFSIFLCSFVDWVIFQ